MDDLMIQRLLAEQARKGMPGVDLGFGPPGMDSGTSLPMSQPMGQAGIPQPPQPSPTTPQMMPSQPAPQPQGNGTINISEDEFRTGGTPPMQIDTRSAGTSSDYNWIDTALDGALGKPEPSRYDYGAPQHNAPGGSARRDYRNDSQIVIEDSTGPNSAGINRTVVQATQRPEYKREQGDYNVGRAFKEQPAAVAKLLESVMGGRGRQQAQQQRPAPAQVLEAIAMAQQKMAAADKVRRDSVAEADKSFFDSNKTKGRALAQKTFDETVAPLNAQLSPYRSQYPSLFGGGQQFPPEAISSGFQKQFPNLPPEMLQELTAAFMSQSG